MPSTRVPRPRAEDRSIRRAGLRERKGGDLRVERTAVLCDHAVGALHRAVRRLQDGAARVLEVLPGAEHGLVPHHAVAAHLLAPAVAVGDYPVPALELGGDGPEVLDADGIGECPASGLGLLGEEAALDGDADALGDGSRHFPRRLPPARASGNRSGMAGAAPPKRYITTRGFERLREEFH